MNLQDQIPELMIRFDFNKVQRVMTFLDWKWAGFGVPEIHDLRATALDLLMMCINEYERRGRPVTGMSCGTGGFEALVNVFDTGSTNLQLLFYVDSCTSPQC